ncbi:SIR2 family protein [Hugenholtzia roseola]|uniref:SIR2 family protein n=1 Tax=Hugenholtzia roseola TaxID=1002 RepID=UPI00041E0836|nr:SIR2 family protein [Hugenholtzia roseola]
MCQGIHWGTIIRPLQQGKCVFVLGDDLEIEAGKNLKDFLFEDLSQKNEEGFLHLQKPKEKTQICWRIDEKLTKITPPSYYEKLVQIPFHTLISLHFDNLLERVFLEKGFAYESHFYYKKKAAPDLPLPTAERPLLYNLFGKLGEDESVVLSKDDVFDFLFSILGDFRLPKTLSQQLQEATNVIFLGCRYNSWQTELIMKLLDFQSGYALFKNEAISESKRIFYTEKLQLEFLECPPQEFIAALYEQCKERDLLRTVQKENATLIRLSEKERQDLETNLEGLLEKLSFFREEKTLATDVEQKFALNKRIKQLEAEVEEIRGKLEAH